MGDWNALEHTFLPPMVRRGWDWPSEGPVQADDWRIRPHASLKVGTRLVIVSRFDLYVPRALVLYMN